MFETEYCGWSVVCTCRIALELCIWLEGHAGYEYEILKDKKNI